MKKYFCILVLLTITLFPVISKSTELIYRNVIDGIGNYTHIDPIILADGTFQGIIASDQVNDRLDIYNTSGIKTDSIQLINNALMTINRMSANNDTLIIYALEDTAWNWDPNNFDVFRITQITIVDEQISIITFKPSCNSTYSNSLNSKSGSIEFQLDNFYQPIGVTFKATLEISLTEPTMGISIYKRTTNSTYSLDFTNYLVQANSTITESLGVLDDTGNCISASYLNYYTSVMDDPWNSYTSRGTNFRIYNCGVTVASVTTENGNTSYLFVQNFLPETNNHEVIYAGYSDDLLGIREGMSSHWACYSIKDSVVTEEWWIDTPWKFEPYFYHYQRNAIVGIVNGLSVTLLSCETGMYTDSISLDHIMYNKVFLKNSGFDIPLLFGRLGDTLYIYNLGTPTDITQDEDYLLPQNYFLSQNYPNPFNPSTVIEYILPRKSHVTLTIYNMLGQEIITLINTELSAGSHTINWNSIDTKGKKVSSGIYLYRLETDDFITSKKMLLLK